jgi:putative hemolysin
LIIEDLNQWLLLIVLLLFSSFFSASETALMSLSKARIRSLVTEGVPKSAKIEKLLEQKKTLLGSILIGNNIVNIGASALATSLAINYFGNTGVGIATGVMTFLVLIFGEITPKSLASEYAEQVSFFVIDVLTFIVFILKPLTFILIKITNVVIYLFGGRVDFKKNSITEEEIKTMINMGQEDGVLHSDEQEMLHNVFEFQDSLVTDVMTPRMQMVGVDKSANFDEVVALFREERYSRIPVFDESLDNIVGILSMKDLFTADVTKANFEVMEYIKEPFFVIEYQLTSKLFKDMREQKAQMAVVVDEHGGTLGIITLEDLIEEIVGEIYDETDDILKEIQALNDHEYIVLGQVKIEDFNEALDLDIASESYDSVAGFVLGLFGRLPEVQEEVSFENLRFKVENMEKNRIDKLRVYIYKD